MEEITLTRTQYAGAIRRHWVTVALIVIVTVGAATVYSTTASKKYEGEANILVTPFEDTDNAFVGIDLLRDRTTSVYTAGRLLTTPQLVDAANRRLRLGFDRQELLDRVKVSPLQQSNLVAIRATSKSPVEAAAIANAFADTLIEHRERAFQQQVRAAIAELEQGLSANQRSDSPQAAAIAEKLAALRAVVGAKDPTLDVFSRAVPPASPVSPSTPLTILVAIVAGLLLGVIAAVARELTDPRFRDDDELARLPVLAAVPRVSERRVRDYLRGRGSLPPDMWESYRTLRASLAPLGPPENSSRTILVTSAIQGEGKTMTSVNLALTCAAAGTRVILVDGDFRRPMVSSVLGVEPATSGLSSLLAGTSSAEDALVPVPGYPSLRVLLGGADRAIDLIEARRVYEVFETLKRAADVVIIDSPPVMEFADAHVLADAADLVLVAIRLGHSRHDEFNQLRRLLGQHGVVPAGFVVTTRGLARRASDAAPPGDESAEDDQDEVLRPTGETGARAAIG
jgi:receptor protein-tyrosine kinase